MHSKGLRKLLHHIALFVTKYLFGGRSRSGVGVGVGVGTFRPESGSESESLKIRRLRNPERNNKLIEGKVTCVVCPSGGREVHHFLGYNALIQMKACHI